MNLKELDIVNMKFPFTLEDRKWEVLVYGILSWSFSLSGDYVGENLVFFKMRPNCHGGTWMRNTYKTFKEFRDRFGEYVVRKK